ncbi:hypothetical protein GCM10009757_46980 [Streptomyces cheonanensis]|uniref:Uncharacterized protein n=1 Tax=Streptomyces cheonanensis TaxID=312720 RepID=A0ABN2VIE1_9ACTN
MEKESQSATPSLAGWGMRRCTDSRELAETPTPDGREAERCDVADDSATADRGTEPP